MKYTTKFVEVDAMKYTKKGCTKLLHWMIPDIEKDAVADNKTRKSIEKDLHIKEGDWIIRRSLIGNDVRDSFYGCPWYIFKHVFEKVKEK